jgi:dTDP-4-amino-4,6-dideoxygalactose transaminase
VATSNCTTALHLALLVAGVGPGDEVICPSMSFIATANAIRHCGATPVFAEVRPDDFNLDPEDIAPRITERTRAILPVHQLGMPAEIDRICRVADAHGLTVVEDAACAIGSSYKGTKIGKPFGRFVCFSFHPRKVITTGEGGMIMTDEEEAAEQLRLLRHHGMSVLDTVRHEARKLVVESYVCVGYNYRMSDIQAAIGVEQMKRLDGIVARRRELAARYNAALADHPYLEPPSVPACAAPNFQSYAVRLRQHAPMERDALLQGLLDRGIAAKPGVMTAHREPAYRDHCAGVLLPVTEQASDRSLLLPLYPGLTDGEQDAIIDALHELFGKPVKVKAAWG